MIPVAEDLAFEEIELGGVKALRGSYPDAAEDAALLYFHGGAFVAGSAHGYRALSAALARAAGFTMWSLDYRLAPEHPFPAAIEDGVAAYRALLASGIVPERIVLAGDSAGGGLVLAALLALREAGDPLPAGAIVLSPWANLACDGITIETKAEEDPSLTPRGLRAGAMHYLGETDPRDPLASPVFADLSGLPPLLIQVGSAEILLDDAVRLAEAAGAAGTAVRLDIWPNMPHVFPAFAFMLEAGRLAVADAGAFMRETTG
jgi:acetyl esterase/lipase